MKYVLVLIICAVSTICVSAQTGKMKVPDAVKASVAQNYPKVKVTEWEIEDGIYEASYLFAQPPVGFETQGTPQVRVADGIVMSMADYAVPFVADTITTGAFRVITSEKTRV